MTLVLFRNRLNEATCCLGNVCSGDQPWRSRDPSWEVLGSHRRRNVRCPPSQLGSCHGTALGLSSRTEQAGSELCFLGRQPVLVALWLPGTESGRAGTGCLSSLQSRLSGHTLPLVPESHKHSAPCSQGEERHSGDAEPHLCPETRKVQISGS